MEAPPPACPASANRASCSRRTPSSRTTSPLGSPACKATGSTGGWNRFTGSSNGWQQVSVDLGAYAGKQVEVAVSYVSDPGTGGLGAFVDDTRLVVGGTPQGAEGFETSLGPWSVPGAPAKQPRKQRRLGAFPGARPLLCSRHHPQHRPPRLRPGERAHGRRPQAGDRQGARRTAPLTPRRGAEAPGGSYPLVGTGLPVAPGVISESSGRARCHSGGPGEVGS